MKQKRTIAAAVLAILMFPSGLQAKDNTVPANYVPADLQSAGIAGNNRIANPVVRAVERDRTVERHCTKGTGSKDARQ